MSPKMHLQTPAGHTMPGALALAVVALAWLSTTAPAFAQGPPPALARLDAVRMESVVQRRALVGDLRAARRSDLAAEEPGLVLELNYEPGDVIEAGSVVARLDDALLRMERERLRADHEARKAEVEENEADLAQAQSDLERVEALDRAGGANERELTQARTAVKAAAARLSRTEAEVLSVEADIRRIERRLERMVISAPFGGQVIMKHTEVGQWVVPGDAVVGLMSTDAVDAYFDVPEQFIGSMLSDDATITVSVDALGVVFEDMPPIVIGSGDSIARTFPVRVRLNNPDNTLKPGMTIRAQIPTAEIAQAMTINQDAIMRNDAGAFVYFDAGGTAAVAPVEPQFTAEGRMVVRSPVLRPGMRVVIEGNERMFPGQPIRNMDEPQPPAPTGGPPGRPPGEQPTEGGAASRR